VVGYSGDKEELLQRLRRVEGQIRGLQRMVSDDEYCIDVITQVTALLLLTDHLDHCVRDAAAAGGPDADEKIREAAEAVARLVRS
jgi:DNA-binding FrmR family transcriptional regulator